MLRWTIQSRHEGEIHVIFDGEITAHSDFAAVPVRGKRVILDLAGVRRLNSNGVHQFLRFLEVARADGRIEAERCSPAIIWQITLLPAFAELLFVRSFFVPLECTRCEFEDDVLIELEPGSRAVVPPTVCGKCRAEMQLGVPQSYFAVLGDRAP
jgi:hypothetical protein